MWVTHLEKRQRKVDLSLRPAWAIEKAPGQPRTHVDIVRQHLKKKKRKGGKEGSDCNFSNTKES